ncbi:MAG: DUF2613 family protein [Corynebacterium sp.]|nr:DUF2613 family protein [Corynebacterium sp.]
MPFVHQSVNRRTAPPAVASTIVGIVAGVAAVVGVLALTNDESVPAQTSVTADTAILGNQDYGSRQQ